MSVVQELVDTLSKNLNNLDAKDQKFALSLVQFSKTKRGLSEKQVYWLQRMAEKAQGIPDMVEPDTDAVGSMVALTELLDTAGKKLQYPRVDMALSDGTTVRVYKASDKGSNPGSLYVKRKQHSWGYIGKVSREGTYQPVRDLETNVRREVASKLECLSADPAKAASEYGHLTGVCCFCGLGLSDERSLSVGYGKTCASNYNLPWGK